MGPDRYDDLFVDAARGDDCSTGDREHPLRTLTEVTRRWNSERIGRTRRCYLFVEDSLAEDPAVVAKMPDDSGWSLRPDGQPNIGRWIKMGTTSGSRFYLSSKYDPELLYRALEGRGKV